MRPRIRWRPVLCFLFVIEALTYGRPFFMLAALAFFCVYLALIYLETWAWSRLNGKAP